VSNKPLDQVQAVNEAVPARLPDITISGRQLREQTDAALRALEAANTPPSIFIRAGELVRLIADETGKPVISVFNDAALRSRLTRVANFFKATNGGPSPVAPPAVVVKDILALGKWDFPPLSNVVEVPVLASDGKIIDRPGYDAESHLYYWPAESLKVPPIPTEPTPTDIAAAVAVIDDAIGEFPYDGPGSKANAIAALLTPVVRPAIKGPVPLALLDAPQQGTGKSLLASVIGLVATGRATAMLAAPDTDEEWRKRITAILHSGASVITIDNVDGQLRAASLANALTAEVWKDRILGRSEAIELPQLATWLATGNNIRLGGDLQRRCYQIRLDAQSAKPWIGREFKHPDLKAWVGENLGEIIAALLTLARAWFSAGQPAPSSAVLGSYESWSTVIGGILECAGVTGFLSNLPNVYEKADEETAEWAEFLEALRERNGETAFTAAEVVAVLEDDNDLVATLPEDLSADWSKKNSGVSFVRRLGKAFSAREGRRHGEMEARIERAGEARNAVKWRVLITIPARLLQFQPAEPGPVAESTAEEMYELAEMVNRRGRAFIAA
jgi:hypothetical protein